MNLLQLVQANPFHGYERENPHAHINSFKRITSTLRFRDVPNDVIKLMMFQYSLEGNARLWYEKEPPNSILTKEDLVTKFVNQFFPPSKTTHLKNEISRFIQKFEETFSEAWEQFKEMHYLNAAAGGNLLSKTTREALNIIENKSKVRYSRNKSNVSRINTNSRESVNKTDERIDKLADQISTLVEIVSKKVVTPAPVKAVEEIYVTCSGPHSWNSTAQFHTSGLHPVSILESDIPTTLPKTTPIPEPNIPKSLPKPNIPYPSRRDDQKFAPMIKSLLMNKEKLIELAKIPLNENCSAMLLKKIPEKLGDPGKFLIPSNFPGMDHENESIKMVNDACKDSFKRFTNKPTQVCPPPSEDVNNKKEKQEVKNLAEPTAKRQTRIIPCLKNFKVICKESIFHSNKPPQVSLVFAIISTLPSIEPKDSLIMGDEHRSTFSTEEIIPIPRESKETSRSDSKNALPSCEDFSSIKVPHDNSVTFSNPLF
ncbi:reverse transcriptase domain-containing protein [Tanacetum coccineum]